AVSRGVPARSARTAPWSRLHPDSAISGRANAGSGEGVVLEAGKAGSTEAGTEAAYYSHRKVNASSSLALAWSGARRWCKHDPVRTRLPEVHPPTVAAHVSIPAGM